MPHSPTCLWSPWRRPLATCFVAALLLGQPTPGVPNGPSGATAQSGRSPARQSAAQRPDVALAHFAEDGLDLSSVEQNEGEGNEGQPDGESTLETSEPTATSIEQSGSPLTKERLRAAPVGGRRRWVSPYEIGDDSVGEDEPCFDWRRPTGILPWLPRTPDRYRFWGPGEPLWSSSWLNRPLHFDAFLGVAVGDKITDQVHQLDTAFGGYRLGWDYDYYWGAEARIVGSHFELFDSAGATNGDYSDLVYGDVSVLYYPWGDARWRPYLSLGMGLTYAHLIDDQNRSINNTMFAMPLAMGVKYRVKDTIAWRFDVTDNLSFGSGPVRTMNNLSLTGGVELHFGGRRRSYWPWNPSRHLWHN